MLVLADTELVSQLGVVVSPLGVVASTLELSALGASISGVSCNSSRSSTITVLLSSFITTPKITKIIKVLVVCLWPFQIYKGCGAVFSKLLTKKKCSYAVLVHLHTFNPSLGMTLTVKLYSVAFTDGMTMTKISMHIFSHDMAEVNCSLSRYE